jgi:hypothetical protein
MKNTTSIDTQMKLYKTVAVRSGLYVCETLVMRSRDKSSLQAAEIRFFGSDIGMTKRDKIINYDIRNKLHMESLNYTVKYRENKKEKHVQRLTENRIPRQRMDYQLQGIRHRGRPRNRWQDQT